MVAIVVPWRPGDRQREKAWRFVSGWWARFGWPIWPVCPPDGPFNRAWAINEGARRAGRWDVLVLTDADVIEDDPDRVPEGVGLASSLGGLVIPHTSGIDLDLIGTALLRSGRSGWQRHRDRFVRNARSRCWVIPRDLFAAVGGFDARFADWGHEDTAALCAFRTMGTVTWMPGSCVHLFHERQLAGARGRPAWVATKDLSRRYRAAEGDVEAMRALLDERASGQRWEGDGRAVRDLGPVPPGERPAPMAVGLHEA